MTVVYCVLCVGRDGNDEFHVFSTPEKANEFAEADQRDHVIYNYVVDHPERMTERSQ